jgi:hypothetical protein
MKSSEMVVHTAERNVTKDKALKPYEMIDFVHIAKRLCVLAKRNLTQDEAMKSSEMVDSAKQKMQDANMKPYEMTDSARYYHDASQRIATGVDDHDALYHALQLQTIIDEMGQLDSTERMIMMQNMMHLNQVPSMVMANMDYFDKYQSTNNHPGQSFYIMERPISNVVLTRTPIEEHVQRIMSDDDKNLPPIGKLLQRVPSGPTNG